MAMHLAGAFVGADPKRLFRNAKGVFEHMHRAVHIEPLSFAKTSKPLWADDKLWLNVLCGDEAVGVYAAIQGYDGYYVPNGNGYSNSFMIILNRSKVIVKK